MGKVISRLKESGHFARYFNDEVKNVERATMTQGNQNNQQSEDEVDPLRLFHLIGVFAVMIIAVLLCCCVFIVELLSVFFIAKVSDQPIELKHFKRNAF